MLCVIYRVWSSKNLYTGFQMKTFCSSKFYGKVGVISWLLFHRFWGKKKIMFFNWDFRDMKSQNVDFFTHDKTPPQNNISCKNISVGNNYIFTSWTYLVVNAKLHQIINQTLLTKVSSPSSSSHHVKCQCNKTNVYYLFRHLQKKFFGLSHLM